MRSFEERKAEVLRRSETRIGEIRRRRRRITGAAAMLFVFATILWAVLLHAPGKISDVPEGDPSMIVSTSSDDTTFLDGFIFPSEINSAGTKSDPETASMLAESICEILEKRGDTVSKEPPGAVESAAPSDTQQSLIGAPTSENESFPLLPSQVAAASLYGDLQTEDWIDIILETKGGARFSFGLDLKTKTFLLYDTDTVFQLTTKEFDTLIQTLNTIQNPDRKGEIIE